MTCPSVLAIGIRSGGRDSVSVLPSDTLLRDLRSSLPSSSGPWEIHAVDLWDEEGEW